jgi:hypothetical protein
MAVVGQGGKGYLESPWPVGVLNETRCAVGKNTVAGPAPELFRMAYEFNFFAEAWKNNDRAACEKAKADTLAVMKILDRLQKAIPAAVRVFRRICALLMRRESTVHRLLLR